MPINLNISPYFDDVENANANNYHKILFVPARAVQARELTQIQSLIQEQVSRHGKHVFKEGSFVLGGESHLELNSHEYVMISETGAVSWEGSTISTGDGLNAKIVKSIPAVGSDPDTLIITYLNSTNSGEKARAVGGDVFTGTAQNGNPITATVLSTSPVSGVDDVAGPSSYFSIGEGVCYSNGYFVQFLTQNIVIDKYSNTPSAKVGFNVVETLIDENDDADLLDNALGSTNFTAPGAHRLKVSLVLETRPIDSFTNQENFIEFLRIKNGNILSYTRGTQYNLLGDTLAKRTFDESGDYTVRPWVVNVREHLDTGNNNGVYSVANGGDETKLAAVLDPGKGFVKGYEVETINRRVVDIEKARDTEVANNTFQRLQLGNYLIVDNVSGFVDFTQYPLISLYDGLPATPGDDPANNSANKIGTAKVRGLELDTGTAGNVAATWKLYLFDVRMSSGAFADVESVYVAGTPAFTAHVEDTTASISDNENNKLIFRLPYKTIKTIRDEDGDSDTSYTVRRSFSSTADGSGNITLSAGSNELFSGTDSEDYVVVKNVDGTYFDTVGNLALSGSPTGKNITISGLDNGQTYSITASINKTVRTEKIKTLVDNTASPLVVDPGTDPVDVIPLNVADVYQVISIIEDAGGDDIDITTHYTLDNGQRDNYYGIGKLVLRNGFTEPEDLVTIKFEYFTHGSGDYFSVDSYTGAVDFGDIPTYISPTTGEKYDLRQCIDFRPRVENNYDDDPDEDAFDGAGASRPSPFKPNTDVRMDLQYYMPRIDSLYVDANGRFDVVKGTPSLLPKTPKVPDNSMWLASFNIPAYTFAARNVKTRLIDNKRYTMADIGKLDRRIQDLEYYSSLNLLEQSVQNTKVYDDAGNERFRNGFIADPFIDDRLSDTTSKESLRAIDPDSGQMRPMTDPIGVALRVKDPQTHAIGGTDYELTTDLITLPYTEVEMIDQPLANICLSVNPFAVFVWDGVVTLTPSRDFWVETRFLPDIVVNTGFDAQSFFDTLRENPRFLEPGFADLRGRRMNPFQQVFNTWERNFLGSSLADEIASSFNLGTDWRTSVSENLFNEILLEGLGQSGGLFGQWWVFQGTINVNGGPLTLINNRVVTTELIPFARTVDVEFTAKGMRPTTKVYPFLSGVNITDYIRDTDTDGPYGIDLITDLTGSVSGVFRIPNGLKETFPESFTGNFERRFNIGLYSFELMDDVDGNSENSKTFAGASFESRGILETRQRTFESTRNVDVRTWQFALSPGADPIAQSFSLPDDLEGGGFVTSIDIYFCEKDDNLPITCQIREMGDEGFPTRTIIPFGSKTLDASEVLISDDSSVATRFTFPDPVYLQEGVEYCFVLMSNSPDYTVHVAEMGARNAAGEAQFDKLTGALIEKQPHAGVLFVSSNNSTWNANQLQDMKFKIQRASFDITATGDVVLENNAVTTDTNDLADLVDNRNTLNTQIVTMDINPLGTTNGSNVIRCYAPNHGLREDTDTPANSDEVYVKIGDQTIGSVNGIPEGEINGIHTVSNVTMNTFDITVTTNATRTGRAGGGLVFYTRNVPYELIHPVLDEMTPSGTGILHFLDHYTSKSVSSDTAALDHTQVTGVAIAANENNTFNEHYAILNAHNEEEFAGNETSFRIRPTLFSTAENLSSVIDTQRLGVICTSNMVDDPQGAEVDYVAETDAENGSAKAKYVTQSIGLTDPAIGLKVYVGVNRPAGADYDMYYKTIGIESDESFDSQPWTTMTAEEKQAQVADTTTFKEDTWIADNLDEFKKFKIKIVLRAKNQALPPVFSDFRVIALGT